MSERRNPYRPYYGVVHRPVLALLQVLGLTRMANKWIRVSNRDYAWPLPGLLAGYVMQFVVREDFQYLAPNYEPRVCGAIQRLVRPGMVCADVGAHLGYMTLLMAKLTGESGRVVSFEVLPQNARMLQRNVESNRLQQRVTVVHRAVSERSQDAVTLYLGPSSFESRLAGGPNDEQIVVPAVALDDYFTTGQRLDFLKMDIEGAETLAFAGMTRLLREQRPTILLEVHDAGWPAVDRLVQAGYRLHDLELRPTDAAAMKSQRLNHCVATPPAR